MQQKQPFLNLLSQRVLQSLEQSLTEMLEIDSAQMTATVTFKKNQKFSQFA